MNTKDKVLVIIDLPEFKDLGFEEDFDFWGDLIHYLLSKNKITDNEYKKLNSLFKICNTETETGYTNTFILLVNLLYNIIFKKQPL